MSKRIASPLELPLAASPAAPPSGAALLYFKSDGKLYSKNSAGVESPVAPAGGAHGHTTREPILTTAPAPVTGTNWSRILTISTTDSFHVAFTIEAGANSLTYAEIVLAGDPWFINGYLHKSWFLQTHEVKLVTVSQGNFEIWIKEYGGGYSYTLYLDGASDESILTWDGTWSATAPVGSDAQDDSVLHTHAHSHSAAATTFSPSGSVAATNVQNAIAELDAEKETPAGAQAKVDTASTADRARANHTGTQPASTITGLAAVATSGSKADVGLGNVDNTSDANKPVSTAQQVALDAKVDEIIWNGSNTSSQWVKGRENALIVNGAVGNEVGDLLIQTNVPATNMCLFHITGHQHVTGKGIIDLWVRCYITGTSVTTGSAVNLGDFLIPTVRFYFRDSDSTLSLAIPPDGDWDYPKITVDFYAGHSTVLADSAMDGWQGSFTSDFTGFTQKLSITPTQYEKTISAGTTAQYWRGDKTWQALNKAAVGLGNVDNTSDAAKPVSTAQQAALNAKEDVLIGEIKMWPVATAPAKHLICDGTAVSRTTYADLYTALGAAASPYGQGDGSTTFNLPDYRDRMPRGATGTGVGSTGGADSVSLTTNQLPSHRHARGSLTAMGAGSHTHSNNTLAVTSTNSAHTHTDSFAVSSTDGTHAHADTFATAAESPAHSHSINHDHAAFNTALAGNHQHGPGTLSTDNPGSHVHAVARAGNTGTHADRVAQGGGALASNPDTIGSGGHTHAVTGGLTADSNHAHTIDVPSFTGTSGTAGHTHGITGSVGTGSSGHNHAVSGSVLSTNSTHTHTLSGGVGTEPDHTHFVSGDTDWTGIGEAVPTLPAHIGVNFIIRALP